MWFSVSALAVIGAEVCVQLVEHKEKSPFYIICNCCESGFYTNKYILMSLKYSNLHAYACKKKCTTAATVSVKIVAIIIATASQKTLT